MGVSGLNPKLFLLFLALLPQFTRPDAVRVVTRVSGALMIVIATVLIVEQAGVVRATVTW